MLRDILGLASSLMATDSYAVWREFDEGRTWRVIAQKGLSSSYRTEMSANGVVPDSIWAVPDVTADVRLRGDVSIYEREGICSMLVVPWRLGKTISGTIVFYWRRPRVFVQEDLEYAAALSNLSAAALNRIELDYQNQQERLRLMFLAEASQVLASSLDFEETLQRVAQLAVPKIADWCLVHLVENGIVSRLVVHAEPEALEITKDYSARYPEEIHPDRGLGRVLRTGEPEIFSTITDDQIVQSARDPEHLVILRELKLKASILVPLVARGRILGALRLIGVGDRRPFTEADVQLAKELALRAATAIDNAQLHRTLADHENELRLSHAAARMGSWSWDQVRQKINWSDEFKLLHGLSLEAQPNFESGRDLVHPDDRERVLKQLTEALASDADAINQEHRSLAPDGRVIWLQSRGRIYRDAEGRATRITGITIDVTESRLAEQALRRTEKLAAAGRLAATVAHEVNNPLEALVNLVYLAQHTEGLPEEAANHLRIADGELRRMAHIVRQTLGFYRESVIAQKVNLATLVSEVIDLYRTRALTRGLTLSDEAAHGTVLSALVNGGEIKQVVANLISNAIDATPPGGLVKAMTSRTVGGIEITVTDTGSGISEANRKHLFEPFFTTKSDVGTGLGLWVSKGIIDKHGGTLVVDPPAESGTTIRVWLPAI